HYDDAVRNEIQSLIQNQQLLVERFVALNANQNQVQLLIETFSNKVFQTSQEFRDQLLNQEELQALSPLKTGAGLAALNTRLALLHDIDDTMEHELQTKLAQTIKATTLQRLVFIVLMSLVTILVISLTIRLVRKVTNNLHLVLEFLSRENYSEDSPLSELIKGKDELSKFAQEVEKLSHEREQAKQKLTKAKEDAERAKDDA
ncbi:hybrid sensor histidine kinase/response regulator, partial [Vibrio sp. 1401]|nr:hybrid sensor histidine kinase/response regulator [Vibrio sp. 1401]